MPIISTIGARSAKVRAIYFAMYIVLAIGAATMVYPLLMMLAGSTKSEVDFDQLSPWPQYLWKDDLLWTKYVQSKYSSLYNAEKAHRTEYGSWRLVTPPKLTDLELANEFREFRADNLPMPFYTMGHSEYLQVLAKNARAYRRRAEDLAGGSIEKYSAMSGFFREKWSKVGPPAVDFATRRFTFPRSLDYQIYYEVKQETMPADRVAVDLDGVFVHDLLMIEWPQIKDYNIAHGTHFTDYDQVTLDTHPPPDGQTRADWQTFVRNELNLAYIRIAPTALPSFQQFLRTRYKTIADLNHAWDLHFASFDEIPFPKPLESPLRARSDLATFVKDRGACPLDSLSVYGIRQGFEDWLASKGKSISTAIVPTCTVDWLDFQEQKSGLRKEFLKRNYLTVLDFLAVHGNGIRNTIIFCTLMVLTNLLVNPLAAYALSRYRPPSTYAILLFCMATMAFPAEVTMIPSFLLLKQFHLLNTFFALVLPGMANGFSIFLLKGFFDSLPRELYEAADIDGAGEWTKFWVLTMNLSKPILAVLALNAFVAAYSEFLMALVIIPDQKMWTMMVWLFELQNWAHPSVVYASLVIAAIPTMLIFIFCQGIIMRGIVVPSEK